MNPFVTVVVALSVVTVGSMVFIISSFITQGVLDWYEIRRLAKKPPENDHG